MPLIVPVFDVIVALVIASTPSTSADPLPVARISPVLVTEAELPARSATAPQPPVFAAVMLPSLLTEAIPPARTP